MHRMEWLCLNSMQRGRSTQVAGRRAMSIRRLEAGTFPAAFSCDPGSDILRIGGLAAGVSGLPVGSNDMLVTLLQNLFTAPQEAVFGTYTAGADAFTGAVARTGATLGLAAVRRRVG